MSRKMEVTHRKHAYDPLEFALILPEASRFLHPEEKPPIYLAGPKTAKVRRVHFHNYLVELAFRHNLINRHELEIWERMAAFDNYDDWVATLASVITKLTDVSRPGGAIIRAEDVNKSREFIILHAKLEENLIFDRCLEKSMVGQLQIQEVKEKTRLAQETEPPTLVCPSFLDTDRGRLAAGLETRLIRSGSLPDGIEGYLVCLYNIQRKLPPNMVPKSVDNMRDNQVEEFEAMIREIMNTTPFQDYWSTVERDELRSVFLPDYEGLLNSRFIFPKTGPDSLPEDPPVISSSRGTAHHAQEAARHLHRAFYHISHLIKYSDSERAEKYGLDPAQEREVQTALIAKCLMELRRLDLLDKAIMQANYTSQNDPKEVDSTKFCVVGAFKYLDQMLQLKARLRASIEISGRNWTNFREDAQCRSTFERCMGKQKDAIRMLSNAFVTANALTAAERAAEEKLEKTCRRHIGGP
ncbi:hypothetical protein MKZ38_001655 [Zalerion maritima]|uniref:Uncharacterized protein n=1 Tax=Zalerion maritima TaxID=339359 RepID=A0AAD5WT10_9PEZI|nr:hypothetical protein MKZ38_001655 [Zalerion maritima]